MSKNYTKEIYVNLVQMKMNIISSCVVR